jgi:hypothetical protein
VTVEDDRDVDDFDVDIVDDDDDEYTPPTREEHERMKRALAKANNEAKKSRLKLKDLLKAAPESKDGKTDDKSKELDRERIRSEVSEAEEARWKKRVVRQAAKAALLEAGLRGDPTKLARLVDEDDVEVDDDGEISDGLEEQIDSIKEDYPDLFEDKNTPPPRNTRRASINAGGSRERPPARKLTSAEKIQQQVLKSTKRR